MSNTTETDSLAKALVRERGHDWDELTEGERDHYRDEARKRLPRVMTDEEGAAVLLLVKGGWLKLELTVGDER